MGVRGLSRVGDGVLLISEARNGDRCGRIARILQRHVNLGALLLGWRGESYLGANLYFVDARGLGSILVVGGVWCQLNGTWSIVGGELRVERVAIKRGRLNLALSVSESD